MEISDKHLEVLKQSNALLRDLIIIELCTAGVTQHDIRRIVGGDMNDINALAKLIRKNSKKHSAE